MLPAREPSPRRSISASTVRPSSITATRSSDRSTEIRIVLETLDVSVKCVLLPAGTQIDPRPHQPLDGRGPAVEAGDRLCNLVRAGGAGVGHPKQHPQKARLVLDAR